MKLTRHTLLCVVVGGVLALGGFAAGRFSVTASSQARISTACFPGVPGNISRQVQPGPTTEANTDWAAEWSRLMARPHSPAADEAMADVLEKLAAHDPARALELALKERHRGRRSVWLQAVLRGWAPVAPGEASAYAAKLPSDEREGGETAVMDGVVKKDPSAAIALAQQLVDKEPARARLHANQLLRVLEHCGDFEAAVDFASRLPDQIRGEMVGTAYQYWSLAQPERAFDAAVTLPAGDLRSVAVEAAVSGWAQGDPAGLAEFSLNLSSPSDRTEALQTALREWVQLNPKAASEWIDKFDPKPELDAGAVAVALHPDVLSKQPEIAASWAESITDPELRSKTLANVLKEWAAKDAAAALAHARISTVLLPAEREALMTELAAQASASVRE